MSLFCAIILAVFDYRAEKILKQQTTDANEVVRFSDVKDFPFSFWLMCGIGLAYYVVVFPFVGLGKFVRYELTFLVFNTTTNGEAIVITDISGRVFFERKFDYSPANANAVNSIVYIISAVASPICGFLVDRTGRNILWVFLAHLVTMLSHGLLAFTFLNPYIAMCIMGLAYSLLASALWPMVSLVVPQYQLGTAYGL